MSAQYIILLFPMRENSSTREIKKALRSSSIILQYQAQTLFCNEPNTMKTTLLVATCIMLFVFYIKFVLQRQRMKNYAVYVVKK